MSSFLMSEFLAVPPRVPTKGLSFQPCLDEAGTPSLLTLSCLRSRVRATSLTSTCAICEPAEELLLIWSNLAFISIIKGEKKKDNKKLSVSAQGDWRGQKLAPTD